MEGEPQSLDHEPLIQSPLKRKPDIVPAEERLDERTMKQQKPDAPVEELRDGSQDDKKGGADQNGNADKGKGKTVLSVADKGKGKMVAEEVGSDEEDGSSEVDGDGDDDNIYLSDDPLEEMDPDNILPVSTRRRSTFAPGAYLEEDYDDYDEDDDDDDDDDEDVNCEEEEEEVDDEEEEEEEEVEEEEKQDESK